MKEILISLITGLFIYFRNIDYYQTFPKASPLTSVAVALWTYASILEPWFIVIGLLLVNIFGFKRIENRTPPERLDGVGYLQTRG